MDGKGPYLPPEWAAATPPPGWSLEILKEGTIVGTLTLDTKTHYMLGRQQGAVDILAEHPSISRQHAVLQFRDDGALMILDLHSAQGSFLNKAALPKDTYQRIRPGDMLKFGGSTRLYIVNGPDEEMTAEYDSQNLRLYREKLAERTAKAEKQQQLAEESAVSWGFGEDAVNDDEEDEGEDGDVPGQSGKPAVELPDYIKNDENYNRKHGAKYTVGLNETETNAKDTAILEKIKAKEQKIQNMQEENRRIYMKEASQPDGLTEGQLSAVKRNDKRIEDLKESIEEMLTQLKTKSAAREKSQHGGKSSTALSRSKETEEDWLDTTEQTADASTNWRLKKRKTHANSSSQYQGVEGTGTSSSSSQVLTYEDLRQQKDVQLALLAQLHRDIAHLEAAEKLGLPSSSSSVQMDEVEALVVATRSKEATLALKPLRIEESKAVAKLASIEKLLKIATPALPSLVHTTASSSSGGSSSSGIGGGTSSESANSKSTVVVATVGDDNNNTTGTATGIAKATSGVLPLNPSTAATTSCSETTVPHAVPPTAASSSSSSSSSTNTATTNTTTTGKDTKKDTARDAGKKRGRDHDVHMQSLASFMQFAEEEKRQQEEAQLRVEQLERGEEVKASDTSSSSSSKKTKSGHTTAGDSKGNSHQNGGNGGVKRPKLIGATMPPPSDSDHHSNNDNDNEFTSSSISSQQQITQKRSVKGPGLGPNALEGGETVWIPPSNQTGDGRTALNAKLGY